MLVNALIVDDDQNCIDALKICLESFPVINIIEEVSTAERALVFLEEGKVQLVFLDIEMNGMDGLQLAHLIETKYPNMMIIFITGHPGFALEGYEVHPVDFLTKPVNINRLEKALKKVREIVSVNRNQKEQKVGLNLAGGIRMFNVNDVLYIEKRGRTIFVVCKGNEKFASKDSMKNLEVIFSSFNFYRTHQSFLVPIQQIKSIKPDNFSRSYTILLNDNHTLLPLSRNKYNELKEILKRDANGVTIN